MTEFIGKGTLPTIAKDAEKMVASLYRSSNYLSPLRVKEADKAENGVCHILTRASQSALSSHDRVQKPSPFG